MAFVPAYGDTIAVTFSQQKPVRVRRLEGSDPIYITYYQNRVTVTAKASKKTGILDLYVSEENLTYNANSNDVVEIDNFTAAKGKYEFTAELDQWFCWGTYANGNRYLIRHPAMTMMPQGCIAPSAAAVKLEQQLVAEPNKILSDTKTQSYIRGTVTARGDPLQIFAGPGKDVPCMQPVEVKAYQNGELMFLLGRVKGKADKEKLRQMLRFTPPALKK